jgi:hypothetical protein
MFVDSITVERSELDLYVGRDSVGADQFPVSYPNNI